MLTPFLDGPSSGLPAVSARFLDSLMVCPGHRLGGVSCSALSYLRDTGRKMCSPTAWDCSTAAASFVGLGLIDMAVILLLVGVASPSAYLSGASVGHGLRRGSRRPHPRRADQETGVSEGDVRRSRRFCPQQQHGGCRQPRRAHHGAGSTGADREILGCLTTMEPMVISGREIQGLGPRRQRPAWPKGTRSGSSSAGTTPALYQVAANKNLPRAGLTPYLHRSPHEGVLSGRFRT